jgi:hypothetical protein
MDFSSYVTSPLFVGGVAKVQVGLNWLSGSSLKVSIVDSLCNELFVISDTIPLDTLNIFYPIMDLPAGNYDVLIQIDNEELLLPLELLDNNIFDKVSVVPNVITTGFADIHYTLKRLPINPLRISIIDFYGNELLEVSNVVPLSLSAVVPLNLSKFLAGIYFVVFELEDALYITPSFTLSIIRH